MGFLREFLYKTLYHTKDHLVKKSFCLTPGIVLWYNAKMRQPRNKDFGRLRSEGSLRTRRVDDKKKKSQGIRGIKHKGKSDED